MRELPADKPCLSRPYCPGCEPDADVLREILEVIWCDAHAPSRSGLDDALARGVAAGLGSAEAGGEDNRRWCEVIHRTDTPAPSRRRGAKSTPPR